MAFYFDENFTAAAQVWSAVDTDEGLFNMANALAQTQNYVHAVQTYNRLLARNPEFASAKKNRDIVQGIIDEINLMSESQKAELGESSKELGDAPLRAEGAERDDMPSGEVEQFSADQILSDKRIQEMWLRQVQQDPSRFLAVKFAMQLQRKEGGEDAAQ